MTAPKLSHSWGSESSRKQQPWDLFLFAGWLSLKGLINAHIGFQCFKILLPSEKQEMMCKVFTAHLLPASLLSALGDEPSHAWLDISEMQVTGSAGPQWIGAGLKPFVKLKTFPFLHMHWISWGWGWAPTLNQFIPLEILSWVHLLLGSRGPSTVILMALWYVATWGGFVNTVIVRVKLFPATGKKKNKHFVTEQKNPWASVEKSKLLVSGGARTPCKALKGFMGCRILVLDSFPPWQLLKAFGETKLIYI